MSQGEDGLIIHFPNAWEKDPNFMKWLQETGNPIEGTRQKRIRAEVARYPCHDEGRNSDIDVSNIPRGTRN